jgi:hypothetical protein
MPAAPGESGEPPPRRISRVLARRRGARYARLPDSMIVWGLTRVFNPAALSRQRFLRDHNELWISRSVLVTLYGHLLTAR